MRIAITGARGQLGTELGQRLAGQHEILPLARPELDVSDVAAAAIIGALGCDLVVHAAAMTHVDGCARDPDAAFRVNALGTRNVALGCQRSGAALVYVSTNEVFDGTASQPYLEFDEPNPINAYGRSKLAGERFVRDLLTRFFIVRTAWVYGPAGDNFPRKILRLASQTGRLRLVTDEVGAPTYAPDLADGIARLIETGAFGTYHFTNEGACSRYDYAARVLQLAGRADVELEAIRSSEYVRPSRPPLFTPLRNFCGEQLGIRLRPWAEALADFMAIEACSRRS